MLCNPNVRVGERIRTKYVRIVGKRKEKSNMKNLLEKQAAIKGDEKNQHNIFTFFSCRSYFITIV